MVDFDKAHLKEITEWFLPTHKFVHVFGERKQVGFTRYYCHMSADRVEPYIRRETRMYEGKVGRVTVQVPFDLSFFTSFTDVVFVDWPDPGLTDLIRVHHWSGRAQREEFLDNG